MCGSRYGVLVFLYALCATPANVSTEYKNAEQTSRPARESFELLDWPKEMLRAIDTGFSQLVSLLRASVPLSASYDGDSSAATSIASGVARRPVTCSMLIR